MASELPRDPTATQLLLDSYLTKLRLPAIKRSYAALAREAEAGHLSYLAFLQALCEQEVLQRDHNQLALRLKQAQFPWPKTLDEFDFTAVPSLNKAKVLSLANGSFLRDRANIILVGNPGTGKTHLAIALGQTACHHGYRVAFRSAAALVTELLAAQKEYRLAKLLRHLRGFDLIICDELGYIPFSTEGAQLLFHFFSDRYQHGSVLITTNLAFAHWTEVFGDERMTAALLDRLTHRAHVLLIEGDSYRFRESLRRQADGQ